MRTVSPELVDSGEKTDTKGRKIADDARRREVLTAYAKSGMTQRVFAQREGVKYSTLVHWLGLSRRAQVALNKPVRFAEVRLGARAPGLEVALPGGIVVRGDDIGQIAALIKALSR